MSEEETRIESICGTWGYTRNGQQQTHLCKGYIVRLKQNWFEGYIKDVNQETGETKLGFVFGIYFNNQAVELFYCHDNLVSRFHCEKEDDNRFVGTFSNVDFHMEIPIGVCEFKLTCGNVENKKEISNKVKVARSQTDYNGKNLYVKIYDNRDRLYLSLSGYQKRDAQNLLDILELGGNSNGKNSKGQVEKLRY